MQFEAGKTYKHQNCIDMMIAVAVVNEENLKVWYVDAKGRLLWRQLDTIVITPDQYENWREV